MTQDISATTLVANRAAGMPSLCKVYVQWDGVNWTDESAYVVSASGRLEAVNTDQGLCAVGNSIADEAKVTLNNQTERFTPWYASGALYSYINNRSWLGLGIRVYLGYYTTPELLSNTGFETAGTGGADTFGSWTETPGNGAIASEATLVNAGSKAAKLTAGASSNTTVHQDVTVTAGATYTLKFYTRGDGTNGGKYSLYDVSNSANIVAVTNTGVTGTTYTLVNVPFTAPGGCTTVRVTLGCPVAESGIAYYDDVSVTPTPATSATTAQGVFVMKGHIEDYQIDVVGRSVTISAKDKSQRLLEFRPRTALLENLRTDEIIEQYINTLPATQRQTIAGGTLVLDKGTYSIPYAWIDDEPLWGELIKIVEAEGGRLYYSPSGDSGTSSALVFENATHLLTVANTVPIFTTDEYTELSGGIGKSRVEYKNAIEVWYYPQQVANERVVWASAEQFRVPAGATKTVKAEFDNAAWSVRDPVNDDHYKDFIVTTAGGATRVDAASITISLYDGATRRVWAQQAYIKVVNLLATDLYVRKLELRGRPVVQGKEQKVTLYRADDGSIIEDPADDAPRAGWRTLTIDNKYVQTREHADSLARFLLDRYSANRLTQRVSVAKAMPWLEVGDRVALTAPGGLSAEYYIQALDWSWGKDNFPMTLDLLPTDNLFKYSDYFLMGTSVLGNGAGKGRAFY